MDNETQKTGANVKQAVPFLRVSNMERSLAYYIDGLGFEMTHKWIDEGKLRWCWLQLGGAALMLQEFRKHPGGRNRPKDTDRASSGRRAAAGSNPSARSCL